MTIHADRADAYLQHILGVIGEAAVKIGQADPDLVATYHTVPWRDMQTMRHKLVHDYFDIDLSIVWDTVQRDLPPLAVQVRRVLDAIAKGRSGTKR
jgi:uncharacterized protein with HEPN domain